MDGTSLMRVSIIIRTKNEEKWITSCLRSVFGQRYKDFEVIIVDNRSTDKTVEKVKAFDVAVIGIEDFAPGKALNVGIRHSCGQIIVCLSGHCIPTNELWLETLIRELEDERVAGVYGRQEPMAFSSDLDRRDLVTIFGLDKKVQRKDPFFHNANSAIRRDVWQEIPFDEEVTNIEDRVWGREVIARGYRIIYEPEASVYHWHGIHQNGDRERCRNVVRILDSLGVDAHETRNAKLDVNALDVLALIPVKGEVQYCGKKPLLEYTVARATECALIDRVVVSTDNPDLAAVARRLGAETPFLRPENLSREYVDMDTVLQYSMERLEENGFLPDIVVVLEVTYPFRPRGFIDQMILKLVGEGVDTVIPVRAEFRTAWFTRDEGVTLLGQGFMPRQLKNSPILISLLGLGCVTYPHVLREGQMIGNNVGILEVDDPYSCLEVRDHRSIDFANRIIDEWWEKR